MLRSNLCTPDTITKKLENELNTLRQQNSPANYFATKSNEAWCCELVNNECDTTTLAGIG